MKGTLQTPPSSSPGRRPAGEPIRTLAARHPAAIVSLVAAALSAARWLKYAPIFTDDSREYLKIGNAILHGRFLAVDNGFRTPLFPLYLALLGDRPRLVFAGHLVLGIAVCLLLYGIFRSLSGRSGIGIAAALLYLLVPSTPYYQASVLTETLAAVCLALGAYFTVRAMRAPAKALRDVALASLAFSLASLDRPEYQLLAPIIVCATVFFRAQAGSFSWRLASRAILAGLAPWVLLVLGWSSVNYARFGWFTLSTLTGYHLTQYSGPYLNEAPPADRAVAEVFLQQEQAFIKAHHGRHVDAFWAARPRLLASTGLSDAQLSRAFLRVSVRLILAHPKAYLSAVAWSWQVFWRPPLYSHGLNLPTLRRDFRGVFAGRMSWWDGFYAYLYLPIELAYAAALVGPFFRKRWRPILWSPGMLSLDIVVLYTAVVTSLFEPEDNNRFKVPVEGLILGIALTAMWLMASDWRKRRGKVRPRQAESPGFVE
ncbi:MAG TPA: hypothetical protein VGZ29_07405 [Terriglobia bacterium]|nr:hypothetical protein [Terriglobia bacterium]